MAFKSSVIFSLSGSIRGRGMRERITQKFLVTLLPKNVCKS